MTGARVLDLVLVAFFVVVLVVLVPRTWAVWRLYAGIRGRRLQDGSSIAPPAPPAVAAVAARLAAIGFQRIGERTLVLPGDKRRFEWDLIDEPSTTYVAIVPLGDGGRMVCYSAFGDGAFVETAYPMGTPVRRPDLVAIVVASSPEDAVTAHRRLLSEASSTHGQALENRTMRDLLERDATYRERHGGATMRRRVYGMIAFTGLGVLAAATLAVRFVLLDG
jgi:hypothetical protein